MEQTKFGTQLKVRVLNISSNEIRKTLRKYRGASWDHSPLFKLIYEDEYGTAGGEPFGCIVGDYYFTHLAPDMEILKGMSTIAEAAHLPFISSIAPSMFNMESWQELINPRNLTMILNTPEYMFWHHFRENPTSRYVVLTLPRVLARLPYSSRDNPVEKLLFEEDVSSGGSRNFTWMNSAYALAANINRAFTEYNWCARIRGVDFGGIVDGLPVFSFSTDSGMPVLNSSVEIAITDPVESELSQNGFLPLSHWRNTDLSVFLGSQTVYKPQIYNDQFATANSILSSRLPYIFAVCRFAHYLKCIVRDKLSSFKNRVDIEDWLNEWISHYVTSDPNAEEEIKAKYPLAEAKISLQDCEDNPGYYKADFYLRPHYQLEELTGALHLGCRIPSGKDNH